MRLSILLTLLLVLVAPVAADSPPKPTIRSGAPAIVAAERAWSAAERERDPKRARAAWQLAAIAFDRAAAVTSSAQGTEAAYAAILAWKNATVERLAVPPRGIEVRDFDDAERGLVLAIGGYLDRATSTGEIAELRFLRASLLRRVGRAHEAIPDWIEIVTIHPTANVAEHATHLLLETLSVQRDWLAWFDWVEKLRGSQLLLENRPDLEATLRAAYVDTIRKRAERLERTGAAGNRAAYRKAAEVYLELLDEEPRAIGGDEILFNAAVCFERAGAIDDATKTFGDVTKRFPKSRLASTARERLSKLGK